MKVKVGVPKEKVPSQGKPSGKQDQDHEKRDKISLRIHNRVKKQCHLFADDHILKEHQNENQDHDCGKVHGKIVCLHEIPRINVAIHIGVKCVPRRGEDDKDAIREEDEEQKYIAGGVDDERTVTKLGYGNVSSGQRVVCIGESSITSTKKFKPTRSFILSRWTQSS